jgi:hypothetical protein
MAPMLKAGLPRAGFARAFPRDVLYGPSLVQGLEVFHPWYHQELLHLLTILNHTQQKTITGQLLTTSFEQLRLELGTSGYLTDASCKTVQKMDTETWNYFLGIDHFFKNHSQLFKKVPPKNKNNGFYQ